MFLISWIIASSFWVYFALTRPSFYRAGSSEKFNEWFDLSAKSDEDSVASAVQQLRRVLRPFMLRRLKVDVAKGLPPKKETIIHVGLTPLQRELYKSILERNLDAVTGGRGSSDRSSLSNIIMHQRKACNHPYLFDNVEDRTLDPMGEHLVENCAKLKLVDKLLPRLQSQKSRVLLFCQVGLWTFFLVLSRVCVFFFELEAALALVHSFVATVLIEIVLSADDFLVGYYGGLLQHAWLQILSY